MSLTRIALATALLFAIPDPASARTIEAPAKPEAGRDYVVLKGTVTSEVNYRFHLDGRSGETVTLALDANSEAVRFRMREAGKDVAADTIRFWSGTLPASGVYDIDVYAARKAAPAHFALTVTLGNPAVASAAGVVRVAAN